MRILHGKFFTQKSPKKLIIISVILCGVFFAGICAYFWIDIVLYDLRDIVKYAFPTLLLLSGVYYILAAGIYSRDYSSIRIEQLQLGDTLYASEVARNLHTIIKNTGTRELPEQSVIEREITGPLTHEKIKNLRKYSLLAQQHPDHSFVAQVKNHPFAPIIFASYIGSILWEINILGVMFREWYFYINQIWYSMF
jgi:prepilin signal peptidase PulO-like enzyme (type II secretory pathway)